MRRNPGDRDLRDLERRAAQGDPAAAEALRTHAERVRPRRWLEDFPTVVLEGDPNDMGVIDGRWRGQWKRSWVKMPYDGGFDPHGLDELVIYTDNSRDLHDWQTKVGGDLMKKYFKGQYDPMKAWKAWLPIVDAAAKRYDREFGGPGARTFNRATRVGAALEIALRFEQQCRFGEERWENLAAEVAASVRPRQRKKNPPSRGDDNLRALERAYLAGDPQAAHAYAAELYRRGMHSVPVPRAPHVEDGTQNHWGRPDHVAFNAYQGGWYVISKNGTWSRASWRTADEALAAAANMISLDNSGNAYYVDNTTRTDWAGYDWRTRTNPGDEDRRRLERLAAQGDPQALARLDAERQRLGGEQQALAQVGEYMPWEPNPDLGHGVVEHRVDGRTRSAGRRVDALQHAYVLAHRLNSELPDDEVIYAFVQRLGAHGRKLTSENLRLDGNWMGGRGIASWQQVPSNSVHLPPTAVIVEHDLGSKAAERILRKVRKAAAAAGVQVVLPTVHWDRGRGDYTGFCERTDRNSKLTSHRRAVTCSACLVAGDERHGRTVIDPWNDRCACRPGEIDAMCRFHGGRRSNPAPLAIMGLGPLPAGLLNPAGGDEEYDVLGPGPGEKGKMGKKPKVVETKLKLSEIEGLPGYKEALASYERFHGAKPTHGMALTVDDGKPGHTVKVVVGLGKVPETHYVTPWKSNKKGYHWIHHHPKGGEPFEVLDPVTGITSKIGGSFRVTDWWRK